MPRQENYYNYYNVIPTKGTKTIATRNISWPQNISQNAFAARTAPRTPLGELTVLLQTPQLD